MDTAQALIIATAEAYTYTMHSRVASFSARAVHCETGAVHA